jgi:hypothetical protein
LNNDEVGASQIGVKIMILSKTENEKDGPEVNRSLAVDTKDTHPVEVVPSTALLI